jgi:hypothetical protein
MQHPNVLDDHLGWIAMLAVLVPLYVETDNVKTFGEQSFGPTA